MEWKKQAPKEETKNFVLNNLSAWSLKRIHRDIGLVTPHLQHNIFDAVGLGMWASKHNTTI
jgi:hypothetical protein